MGKKTDNRSLASKITLRRWLLDKMGITDDVRVLDTCSGAGLIWSKMEEHCHIAQWTRCDIKPRVDKSSTKITLKMEASVAIRSLPVNDFNVIDIDPYGSPWDAYRALLLRLKVPMAVFLTHGQSGMRVLQSIDRSSLDAVGLPSEWIDPIKGMTGVQEIVTELCLAYTWRYAEIAHAGRISILSNFARDGRREVHYYGLHLIPRPEPETPLASLQHPRAVDMA
jgi:hypothetical protein